MRQIISSALNEPCLRCAQHYRAARPFTIHCMPTFGLLLCPENLTQKANRSPAARRRPSSALHAEGVPCSKTLILAIVVFCLHSHSIRRSHVSYHFLGTAEAVQFCGDLVVEERSAFLSQVAQSLGQEQRQGSLRTQILSSRKRLSKGTYLSPSQ